MDGTRAASAVLGQRGRCGIRAQSGRGDADDGGGRPFLQTIADTGCDYVYFTDDIPLAGEQLPELFAEGTERGALYRIESAAADGAVLSRIN